MNGPTTVVDVPYVVREPFKAFHARHQKKAILVYHRRAGKTVATVNDLVAKALRCRKPNGFFAYIAPFAGQAVQTAWAYLQEAVRKIPGHKVDLTLKQVKIPSAHGSLATIRLFGADNPNSLRGLYFDGIVLDEVADMKKMVWAEVLQPALMDRDGWVVFIGTPKGKNFFYDLYEEAKKKPEYWFSQVLKASDSKILPQKKLDEYRETVDEETYEQEMECSFTAGIRGAYYASTISEMEYEGKLDAFEIIKAAPVHVVLDLGYTDATAAWFFQIINGELLIIDYDSWNEIKIDDVVDDIQKRGYRMGDYWLPHDAKNKSWQTGKSGIELMLARGIKPRPVPELSVTDGIAAVRYTLPKARFHGQNCNQGIECLKNYKKKELEGGGYSKSPIHDWSSHGADAFRYLCLAVRDKDIAASVTKRTSPVTSESAHKAWETARSINIPVPQGITLDQAFARQPRRTTSRI